MNEEDFARGVRGHLDAGADALPPRVLQRLQTARDAALARASQAGGSQAPITRAAGAPARSSAFSSTRRLLAPLAVALLALAGVLLWQQEGQQRGPMRHAELAELDTEVLTGDLPVTAYLDPGFEIWLYHHSAATAED
jgi:hypothetical protein